MTVEVKICHENQASDTQNKTNAEHPGFIIADDQHGINSIILNSGNGYRNYIGRSIHFVRSANGRGESHQQTWSIIFKPFLMADQCGIGIIYSHYVWHVITGSIQRVGGGKSLERALRNNGAGLRATFRRMKQGGYTCQGHRESRRH